MLRKARIEWMRANENWDYTLRYDETHSLCVLYPVYENQRINRLQQRAVEDQLLFSVTNFFAAFHASTRADLYSDFTHVLVLLNFGRLKVIWKSNVLPRVCRMIVPDDKLTPALLKYEVNRIGYIHSWNVRYGKHRILKLRFFCCCRQTAFSNMKKQQLQLLLTSTAFRLLEYTQTDTCLIKTLIENFLLKVFE